MAQQSAEHGGITVNGVVNNLARVCLALSRSLRTAGSPRRAVIKAKLLRSRLTHSSAVRWPKGLPTVSPSRFQGCADLIHAGLLRGHGGKQGGQLAAGRHREPL
jgi:hypothetical protein